MDEIVVIESYFHKNPSVSGISKQIVEPEIGHGALDFYNRYKTYSAAAGNELNCPQTIHAYEEEKVTQSWTPYVIAGRYETP